MEFLFVTRKFAVMNNTQVGGGVRSTLLIEALSKLGHVDVISFIKEPVESSIPNCDVIFSGETPERKIIFGDRMLIYLKFLIAPWHPEAYYPIDQEQAKIISRYYNAKHYDFVVCHFIWEAVRCGLMRYADRLIIDVDDNLVSVAKRNQAKACNGRMLKRFIQRWRTRMIGKMQQHVLKRVKLSFYSNDGEPPYAKSVFLHNVPLLSCPCGDLTERTPMRLLFVGNIDFFPNKNGLSHFVKAVFPIIKKRIPAVELNIVGLCKDQDFKSRLCSIPGVHVVGFVENLREEYQNCSVVIVPIYHGAGTCIKFIEGMMMSRPVVSSPVGARGFDRVFQANRHYWLANSDQEFADHIIEILSDRPKASLMAREACEIAKANFSKESFFEVVKTSLSCIQGKFEHINHYT